MRVKTGRLSRIREGGNARAMRADSLDPDDDRTITYASRKAYADAIKFDRFARRDFVNEMLAAFRKLNELVRKNSDDGTGIWTSDMFNGTVRRELFLGSSEHLFNLGDIGDDEYTRYKPKTGDIDIGVPESKVDVLNDTLDVNENLRLSDKIVYVGRNRGPIGKQSPSCIFAYHVDETSSPIFVQVDFVGLEFEEDVPNQFSRFSRSSSWDDIKAGIKGVFHKYLLSSVTNAIFEQQNIAILTPSSISRGLEKRKPELFKVSSTSPESGRLSSQAFSIHTGLRSSISPVIDPATGKHVALPDARLAFRKLETSESISVRDQRVIFEKFFDHSPTDSELKKFSSFKGVLELVKENKPEFAKKIFGKFVAGKLFGRDSQGLYASSPEADRDAKMAAVNAFIDIFPELSSNMDFVERLKSEYYESYKTRSVSNESFARKGAEKIRKIVRQVIAEGIMQSKTFQLRSIIREEIKIFLDLLESPRGRRLGNDYENMSFFGSAEGAPEGIEMVSLNEPPKLASVFGTQRPMRKTWVWTVTGETVKALTRDIAYQLFKDALRQHVNSEINARSNPSYEKNDFWENIRLKIEDIEEI